MKIRLLEVLDDYPIELEGILDNSYIEAPVYYDQEDMVKHPAGEAYPGHEEAGLDGEPVLYLDDDKKDYFPDELYDSLVEWINDHTHRVAEYMHEQEEAAKAAEAERKMEQRRIEEQRQ